MADDLDQADQIYVARSVIYNGEKSEGAIGVGDLVSFLIGRTRELTAQQIGYLSSRPDLLSLYERLKSSLNVAEMPVAASLASDPAPDHLSALKHYLEDARATLS
ncbi:hypothetical protein ACVWWK_003398, partial [Bradyrhizobium sp. LB9.1b]